MGKSSLGGKNDWVRVDDGSGQFVCPYVKIHCVKGTLIAKHL